MARKYVSHLIVQTTLRNELIRNETEQMIDIYIFFMIANPSSFWSFIHSRSFDLFRRLTTTTRFLFYYYINKNILLEVKRREK